MADIQQEVVDLPKGNVPGVPMDWQRMLLGWGFLLLIAAFFVGTATKAGVVSKLIGVTGLLMIAISTVALAANWLRSKSTGKKPTTTESRS
jgi:hypothetical protein